jgi:hypothetical protein
MAECPKLATRRNGGADEEEDGLTEQLNHCKTSLSKLAPGSNERSESPPMVGEEDQ